MVTYLITYTYLKRNNNSVVFLIHSAAKASLEHCTAQGGFQLPAVIMLQIWVLRLQERNISASWNESKNCLDVCWPVTFDVIQPVSEWRESCSLPVCFLWLLYQVTTNQMS